MKAAAAGGLLALGSMLSGCISEFDGTAQDITVYTDPAGAFCAFAREGVHIGEITDTPGILNVRKSKYDILITCSKPGYLQTSTLNRSGLDPRIVGNIFLDVFVTVGAASIVDSATGADNHYDEVVHLSLLAAFTAQDGDSLP